MSDIFMNKEDNNKTLMLNLKDDKITPLNVAGALIDFQQSIILLIVISNLYVNYQNTQKLLGNHAKEKDIDVERKKMISFILLFIVILLILISSVLDDK